jgi:hypothetical protein
LLYIGQTEGSEYCSEVFTHIEQRYERLLRLVPLHHCWPEYKVKGIFCREDLGSGHPVKKKKLKNISHGQNLGSAAGEPEFVE